MKALNEQLQKMQHELAQKQAAAQRLEADLRAARSSPAGGSGGDDEARKLREQNRALQKELQEAKDAVPKSSACVLL